ncbi:MAG: glycosyltransferase family 39 protein [Nitrospinae bacterium]|nr:glycosyltransferase family 39 protein [Nitrospinota bacterium]
MGRRFLDFKNKFSSPYYFLGERHEDTSDYPHPPGIPAIHYLILRAFPNASEPVFHGIFLVFTACAVVFTYLFCLRFSKYPLLVAAWLFFSPPFFILSHNITTGIVLYGFIIGSLLFYVRAVDGENRNCLWAAVFLFALALGSGFQAAVFYAAFFLYAYLRRPKKMNYFLAMGLSTIPLVLFYGYVYSTFHWIPRPINLHLIDAAGKRAKILYYLSQFSLAFLAPIAFSLAVCKKERWKSALMAAIAAWAVFSGLRGETLNDYSRLQKWTLYGGGFFTFFSLFLILSDLYGKIRNGDDNDRGRNDTIFLGLTAAVFLSICVVFTPFGASRYMLPGMAFVFISLLRQTETVRPWIPSAALVLCAAFSFWTAKADYDLAEFYRRIPGEIHRQFPGNQKIWFNGEWGFKHYMEQSGYRLLRRDAEIEPDDLIVEPTIPSRMDLGSLHLPLQLKMTIHCRGPRLKVLHYGAKAGFWSQAFGLLPFWTSSQPVDQIRIYQVVPQPTPLNLNNVKGTLVFPEGLKPEIKVLGGTAREAARLEAPGSFDLSFVLRQSALLQFGMGLVLPASGADQGASALFMVTAVSEGRSKVVFQRELKAMPAEQASWADAGGIGLEEFAGHPLKLTFQASGLSAGSGVEALWSSMDLVEQIYLTF